MTYVLVDESMKTGILRPVILKNVKRGDGNTLLIDAMSGVQLAEVFLGF